MQKKNRIVEKVIVNPKKKSMTNQDCSEQLPGLCEDEVFKIEADPEDVAKALFAVNPNKEGFEWQYLKEAKAKGEDGR